MADINNRVSYSDDMNEQLRVKAALADFTFRNWGDDDLENVRTTVRNFYRLEQNGICAYCKQNLSLVSALNCHVEHIVPKSLHLNFIFTPKNLCVVCADCNTIKREQEVLGDIPETLQNEDAILYPRTSQAFKIVHPHFDNYSDHILISNGFYIDRTVKGHFTIGACKLNRKLHVFGYDVISENEVQITEMLFSYLDEKDGDIKKHRFAELKNFLNGNMNPNDYD